MDVSYLPVSCVKVQSLPVNCPCSTNELAKVIVAGCGSFMQIYPLENGKAETNSCEKVADLKIFDSFVSLTSIVEWQLEVEEKADGASVFDRVLLIVLAERNLAIVKLFMQCCTATTNSATRKAPYCSCNHEIKCTIQVLTSWRLNDWAIGVHPLKGDLSIATRVSLAVLLGTNIVEIYNVDLLLLNCSKVATIHGPLHCLVSSCTFTNRSGSCYCFFGTMFGDIYLWRISERNSSLLKRLSGHDGVVTDLYLDEDDWMLFSVSDDRSLRVWSVGTLFDSSPQHSDCAEKEMAAEYAHSTKPCCLTAVSRRPSVIATASQDGDILFWRYDVFGQLSLLKRLATDLGAVRCLHSSDDAVTVIGCASGALAILRTPNQWESSFTELVENSVATFCCLDRGRRLFIVRLDGRMSVLSEGSHTNVALPQSHAANAVRLAVLPAEFDNVPTTVAVAVTSSHQQQHSVSSECVHFVTINDEDCVVRTFQLFGCCANSETTLSMHWIPYNAGQKERAERKKELESLLIFCRSNSVIVSFSFGSAGERVCYRVVPVAGKFGTSIRWLLSYCGRHIIPSGRHSWVTCCTAAAVSSADLLLFVGDRNGTLSLYKLDTNSAGEAAAVPMLSFSGVHGPNGVTDLCWDNLAERSVLFSVGRDGNFIAWKLNKQGGSYSLEKTATNSISLPDGRGKMDWPARILRLETKEGHIQVCRHLQKIGPGRERCILAGFRSSDFCLYDMNTNILLCRFECGGGRRAWNLELRTDGVWTNCHVFFIKNKSLYKTYSVLWNLAPVKWPLHKSQITCVVVLPKRTEGSVSLLTGSLDTSLAISDLSSHAHDIMVKQHLKGAHSNSVLSLAVCPSGERVCSVGAKSELVLWGWDRGGEAMTVLDQFRDFTKSVRFTHVEFYGEKLLLASRSDGCICVLVCCESFGIFEVANLVAGEELRSNCCIISFRTVTVPVNWPLSVIAVSTGGDLFCWCIDQKLLNKWKHFSGEEERRPVYDSSRNRNKIYLRNANAQLLRRREDVFVLRNSSSRRLDSCGVCCLDMIASSGDLVVAFGCESGRLGLLRVRTGDFLQAPLFEHEQVLHSSTVTDVKLLLTKTAAASSVTVVSIGIDQRLCVSVLDRDLALVRMVLLSVADPSSCCLLPNNPMISNELKRRTEQSGTRDSLQVSVVVVGSALQLVKL